MSFDVQAYLHSLSRFGMKPGLERIRALLRRLGDPQMAFPAVHVAGTNGKGSIASMTASVLTQAGYRVGLSIRGRDYEYGGASGGKLSNFKNELKVCGPFLHDDPRDRPPAIFRSTTSLHFGRGKAPYLLLPVIPPKKRAPGRK